MGTSANTNAVPDRTRKHSQLRNLWRQYRKNTLALFGLILFTSLMLIALLCPLFVDYDTDVIAQNNRNRLQPPSAEHIFGTDHYGRDVFSRVIWGTRISLFVGLFTVGFAASVGGAFGAVSGYYGGATDNLLMRIMDIFLAMPGTILAVAIVGALGPGLINILWAMSICRVPQFARVVRSSVISLRSQEFIEAAKACATKDFRIIMRHILPNCVGPIVVQCTLHLATTILGVAGLSFIGLGIQPPDPEWGSMLSEARVYMRDSGYLMAFPGLAIVLSVLALNLIGDGLRDALDPRLKR